MQISSFCIINNSFINLNGTISEIAGNSISEKLLHLYRKRSFQYPKFFKMDSLCQLGFLGCELMFSGFDGYKRYKDDEIAIVLMNSDSSLDTDIKHQQMISSGKNASPAVFVYTLPNIVAGEIAIRMNWHGENIFILTPDFDLRSWIEEVKLLFDRRKAQAAIGGWINMLGDQLDLRLFFIENTGESLESDTEKINTFLLNNN